MKSIKKTKKKGVFYVQRTDRNGWHEQNPKPKPKEKKTITILVAYFHGMMANCRWFLFNINCRAIKELNSKKKIVIRNENFLYLFIFFIILFTEYFLCFKKRMSINAIETEKGKRKFSLKPICYPLNHLCT